MPVYDEPRYIEIAFSFVDAEKPVDLFEEFIEAHSRIEVKRFPDIGCGPAASVIAPKSSVKPL